MSPATNQLQQQQQTSKPIWLRQRSVGKKLKQTCSLDDMHRLKLESTLEGHQGCVNCLEWNRRGNLLASGSDDHNVIIWDPFKASKRNCIKTGHVGNIFSVKFIQDLSDTLVATCSSHGEVKLTNTLTNEVLMNCNSCHLDRVKRLETHPNEPYLVWSAGEEGYIMQYDIREAHSCCNNNSSSSPQSRASFTTTTKPKNLLLDLKTSGFSLIAKCLAVNPLRDEMLAVGSNDVFVRLFDRRFMSRDRWDCCSAYFSPGHLVNQTAAPPKQSTTLSSLRTFGTTYLAFSPDGSELLANFHAEQVYLFNTYEPCEAYKSFDCTVKPLILDYQTSAPKYQLSMNTNTNNNNNNSNNNNRIKFKPYSPWRELRKLSMECVDLPKKYLEFCSTISSKLNKSRAVFQVVDLGHGNSLSRPLIEQISKFELDKINELLAETKNCKTLYNLRAGALIQRGWRGDFYQAIRDCCCTLALDPLDISALDYLAFVYYYLDDKESASGLLKLISALECSDQDKLKHIPQIISYMSQFPFAMPTCTSPGGGGGGGGVYLTSSPTGMTLAAGESLSPDYYYHNQQQMPQQQQQQQQHQSMGEMFVEQSRKERSRASIAFDYSDRFCGHCNMHTDIKEVNFFGPDGEFIVGGSDDGAFYIWDKKTTNIVKAVYGDMQILNCLQPHPSICMLATSGIEPLVKLWSPSGKTNQDVKSLDLRCSQNQDCITSDPLEAMIMRLYPNRDI